MARIVGAAAKPLMAGARADNDTDVSSHARSSGADHTFDRNEAWKAGSLSDQPEADEAANAGAIVPVKAAR
eukprot:187877-Rhodomonas_salina.1